MDNLCQAPCAKFCQVVCRVGNFSYTSPAGIYFTVWRVGSLFSTSRVGICSSGQESLLFVPYWNLSRRSAGGDFLLHTPSWNLSGCTSGGESILHALFWHVLSFVGRALSLTRYLVESVCSFGLVVRRWGEFLLHAL